MTAETTRKLEALALQAQTLMSVFTKAGYDAVAPAIIQPADVFLDVIGEGLRARTYVFTDQDGAELCLRPDITVPTCRLHLERHADPMTPARYCYTGPAFRFQPQGATASHPREFRQAGIERFGDKAREAAEAETVATIIKAIEKVGLKDWTVRLGDLGLFSSVLDAADLSPNWKKRLDDAFLRPQSFREALKAFASGARGAPSGVLEDLLSSLKRDDKEASEAAVAVYLEEEAIELIGTRSLADITDHLIVIAEDRKEKPLDGRAIELIERYVGISGPAITAGEKISALLKGARNGSGFALETYDRRIALLANAGIDLDRVAFSAEFGRTLAYYTGLVFEVNAASLEAKSPIAGGGRYDGLMRAAGAETDIPAVGAAIHSERLLAATEGAGAMSKLTLAIPSKGRLMEQTTDMFARAGLIVRKVGHVRGYRGEIDGMPGIDVAYVSSSEIAEALKAGSVHLGITGEDMIRENISDSTTRIRFIQKLGFGFADVVVAVPTCWIDVATVADLEEIAIPFRRLHGRWPRVATKYVNLTRRFFGTKGFGDYRIIESAGATEGAPAAGTAELIVDITTTGETLRANGLKILDDGVILKSQANLFATNAAAWTPELEALCAALAARLGTASIPAKAIAR